ncbi:putative ribonuclease H-like domain-containing protein [Tanacetum coccineum]
MESQSESTQTVSALILPMLKTGDYDLWSMRMEQYLTHTDYALWEVIVNGDSVSPAASASASTEGPIPPKTAEQKLARKNELKAKSTLLLAIPDEHILKFHGIKDAKTLWEAIKTRFGGNKESKKMQKTILKQQYENFTASKSEGLDKTYDRFQKLISQLEIHGEVISQEDVNLKLLRSLPSAWNTHTLIMHNKSDLEMLSMDDLYNNFKVTNESVNTAHDVSTASSQGQLSSSTYVDDVMFSFFANQSNSLQLDNEDLEQINTDDLEEMDLKWKVVMLTMRVKRFIKKIRRNLNFNGKETVGFDKIKVECYNCHMRGHFARECRAPKNQGNRNGDNTRRVVQVETPENALVVTNGMGYDWSYQAEEGPTDFALMAHSSSSSFSSSSSDTEYDQQREAFNKSNLEIIGYQMGLESLEARIVVHEKNEAVYEENIAFLIYDVQVKDISIKDLKNYQISAKDKTSLGYDGQMNESELNNIQMNKSEMVHSVFNSRESDEDDNPVNDRFKIGEGFHTVPPPYTRNYMPPRPDLSFAGLNDSVFKSKESDSDDDYVVRPSAVQIKAKFTKINFVKSVLTKSGQVLVNTAKQSFLRAAVSNSTARYVNTVVSRPTMNKKVYTAKVNNVTTAGPKAVVSAVQGYEENAVKSLACWIWRPTRHVINHISKDSGSSMLKRFDYGNPQYALKDQGIFNSGCSRHMTGNKFYLSDYQDIDGRFVAFAGSTKGGKITGKGKIRIEKLDFEDVYFVKELKFNLFYVSQMCDKKNNVFFTKTECLVLSPDFKLLDESQVLLKVPRQNNMYSFNLKNVVPSGGLTCLFAKATIDESNLWHRRLGHINFKTMNKLVRGNLVRGLPSKIFENDHTCVACQKGKRHKASCKTKLVSSISQPLQMLHMDLFGPTFVKSLNKKMYCLVVTGDINKLLPTIFWAEAINTACYVQNRVLITKPHNKTPYELLIGRPLNLDFMRPFGCPVTILNTLDHLGKFEGKADEGFLVGYSINSKAFRVFNTRTRKVEENLHIKFLENKFNVVGSGPEWLFDIDSLTKSMNYETEKAPDHEYILLPLIPSISPLSLSTQSSDDKDVDEVPGKGDEGVNKVSGSDDQERTNSSTQDINIARPSINTASTNINTGSLNINIVSPNDLNMPSLEETGIFDEAYDDEDVAAEADLNNLETTINVSPIPTTRIHKDHPKDQIIGDLNLSTQTRRMINFSKENAMVSYISKQRRTNHKDYQNFLFVCFLSQNKPKKVIQALTDLSWIEAMQEELLQFKHQKVWTLVDLPKGKRAIRTKIEAIRLFLAYASFMGLIVYQMDMKSAFLYGTIEEEVFRRGTIDKTLFIKKDKGDILLVQVYVDDIIFGFTKKSLCVEFEQMMHKRFQMSSMGELTFFLGLQVQQKEDGIFISQDKYVANIFKKFDFVTVKTTSTPIESNKALIKDEEAKDIDVHLYKSMIGSLMYLTASRPDIMFDVCACARFQVTPKVLHLHAVKRIFRYLKGQPKLGLWYPRDSPFDLEAFFDSDYAGASLDRKSTTGGCQFLGKRLISWQCKKQSIVANSTSEAEYVVAANFCGQYHLRGDETVYKEWEDIMERVATTASSLEAE